MRCAAASVTAVATFLSWVFAVLVIAARLPAAVFTFFAFLAFLAILDGHASAPTEAVATLFSAIETVIAPLIDASASRELSASLQGLDGRFVPPGPSGAPTRARLDVLPTGRNFFSVDTRAVPTQAAWRLGWKSASLLVERYAQDQGDWPRRMLLSCWGTANMRTGGEDIAQALALLGVKPQWDTTSGRVTGFEVLPLDAKRAQLRDAAIRRAARALSEAS